MTKKKITPQIFKTRVYDLVGEEYTVVSQYINYREKLIMRHNNCKKGGVFEYPTTPHNFLSGGARCPKCAGSMKKNTEQFKKEVYEKVGDEYVVLGEYANTHVLIEMFHNNCQKNIYVYPNDFLNRGVRCKYCSKKRTAKAIRKTQEQFEKEFYEKVGDEYTLLESYKGNKTRIKAVHNVCKKEIMILPNSFLDRGDRCRHCGIQLRADKRRKTTNEFKKEVFDQVGNEYEVLGDYLGNKNKIKMKHIKCKEIFYPTPNNFLGKDSRCPYCQESKGERKIRRVLQKKKVDFTSQHEFPNCKFKRVLPFDFAVFKDSKLQFVIEFQGQQHYHPLEFFGGEENLRMTQKRDKIKMEYCLKNNIELIIIPYNEYAMIEKILKEVIDKFL